MALATIVEELSVSATLYVLSERYSCLMKDRIKVLEYIICHTYFHNDEESPKLTTKSAALSRLKKYKGVSDYDLLILTLNWDLANHDVLASLEIAVAVLLDGRISRNDYCGLNLKSYQNAHAIAHYYHLKAISFCKKLLIKTPIKSVWQK